MNFIFDMDGTMFRNLEYHFEAWEALFTERNKPFSEHTRNSLLGKTAREAIKEHFGAALSEDEVQRLCQQKEEHYRRLYGPKVQPVTGLLELLKNAKVHNIRCAIATSGTQENIDLVLNQSRLRDYFLATVNASEVDRGKPAPDVFLLAASRLNASPTNCIVFEDAVAGLKAAKAAGMLSVGLTTYKNVEDLPGADLYAQDFTELDIDNLQLLVNRSLENEGSTGQN